MTVSFEGGKQMDMRAFFCSPQLLTTVVAEIARRETLMGVVMAHGDSTTRLRNKY
jgi:hypothetical protein